MRVIKGRVFFRGRLDALSVGIDDDGKIVAVRKVLRGDEETDHGDALILPGCVDLHVHMRDPGLTQKEDFPSGTRSAALGGVTTVAEMPNTVPPVTSRSAYDAKAAALRGRSGVDFLLYAAPRSGEAAARLRQPAAFKAYMAESTGALQLGREDLRGVLHGAKESDKLVVVHAEDPGKFLKGSARGLEDHSAGRPKAAESSALQWLLSVRGDTRLHIAHVTCKEALDALPPGATCEVTPHHLFLDTSTALGARGKVNPPLRPPADREALWAAFTNGRIDIVASDHAPHTIEEKDEPFDEAPAGVPGVATSFPLLMRHTRAGDMTLERLVSMMASRPAEILGIRKGTIEVGRDADLVVIDPRSSERIRAKRLRSRCGWTPFEGFDACFPQSVYLRGERIIDDGEPAAEGTGRLVANATPSA
jgi:dihydroorotase